MKYKFSRIQFAKNNTKQRMCKQHDLTIPNKFAELNRTNIYFNNQSHINHYTLVKAYNLQMVIPVASVGKCMSVKDIPLYGRVKNI